MKILRIMWMTVLAGIISGQMAACSPDSDHDIDDNIENDNNNGGKSENEGDGENAGTGSNENLEPKVSLNANGVMINMVLVEGGTFQMGATAEQGEWYSYDERPVHQVTLSDYYIGETEVTQELWLAVMGYVPSDFSGNLQLPVENVSWEYCQEFIWKLSGVTGVQFRMPTEAEWEFAARGGNLSKGYRYSGSSNINEVAWYGNNSDGRTHEVGSKDPNELGLYDMNGNVFEWCQDWYGEDSYSHSEQINPSGAPSGVFRVIRGGCWGSVVIDCRVASRDGGNPLQPSAYSGLRLALSPSSLKERNNEEKKTDTNHEYVDLGLPSGTLWATCNIGASSPEEYGDYFAWGMTEGYDEGKTYFDWVTYKWCGGSFDSLKKYNTFLYGYGNYDNKTVLELEDDAAYVNWGQEWCMPSREQLEELINPSYTTVEMITQNGVYGGKITSRKNGKFIFLPAAGYRSARYLVNIGSADYYWARTLNDGNSSEAWALVFVSEYDIDVSNRIRCNGYSVRPVRVSK